jgi:hypothetical protein
MKLSLLGILLFFAFVAHSQAPTAFVNSRQEDLFPGPVTPANHSIRSVLELPSIKKVDSIGHLDGVGKYFADIYFKVMQRIAIQMEDRDSVQQQFVIKFETSFADYFTRAWETNEQRHLPTSSEWYSYFSHTGVESWRSILFGVNAHTNADMWQALVKNFSEADLKKNKKQLLAFQRSIAKEYAPFFDYVARHDGYVRFMNTATLGLTKKMGERYIYKWRKRQYNLAILYHHDPRKFKRKWAVINRKKLRIDQLVLDRKRFFLF